MCWENPKTWGGLLGLTALGTYIGVEYASLSADEKTCMLQCLPTNWKSHKDDNASSLNYQGPQLGPDDKTINPRCVCPNSSCEDNKTCSCPGKGGTCETFCKAACVKEYNPNDPFNYIPGGKALENIFGKVGNIVKWGILVVVYLIIICVVFFILRFVYNQMSNSDNYDTGNDMSYYDN